MHKVFINEIEKIIIRIQNINNIIFKFKLIH